MKPESNICSIYHHPKNKLTPVSFIVIFEPNKLPSADRFECLSGRSNQPGERQTMPGTRYDVVCFSQLNPYGASWIVVGVGGAS